jgi:hypothetical protein
MPNLKIVIYFDVARMRENMIAYGTLVGKPVGKRPLGRYRHRWEDNIKTDLRHRMGRYGLIPSDSG